MFTEIFVQSTNQWCNKMFELEEKLSWKRPTVCRR